VRVSVRVRGNGASGEMVREEGKSEDETYGASGRKGENERDGASGRKGENENERDGAS
jgi:hypothetical protein